MRAWMRGLCAAAGMLGAGALAGERLARVPPEQYSEEQKAAARDFEAARKVPVFGPFEPLMHSPQLMSDARAMGDYLRYHASIGVPLSEFAILVVAREWSQDYEWYVHYPLALKAGLKPEIADAIAEGRRPPGMSEEQDAVYAFLAELQHGRAVSDATYERMQARFGDRGVVDLAGLAGYYTLLAMELNVARYRVPKDARTLPRLP